MKEDIGLKIGTPLQIRWTTILEGAEKDIETAKIQIEINEMIIEKAKKRISEEEKK